VDGGDVHAVDTTRPCGQAIAGLAAARGLLWSRAAARLALEDRVAELESRLGARDDASVIGQDPAIAAARALCDRLAPTDVPVLLTGESGTGKEVFARRIHARSRRAERPLIPPAIPWGSGIRASRWAAARRSHRRRWTGSTAWKVCLSG
jgi:transcriptional regulator with GAF, ATPase, and Fis domain